MAVPLTSATAAASHTRVTSSWHSSLSPLAAVKEETPFHAAQWATAWQHVSTEHVLASRHLLLQRGGTRHHLPFYLIDSSPLWAALEKEAGVRQPVFDGRPVVYAPSIYGEYGGIPHAPTAVLTHAAARGVELAREWEAPALVLPNLQPLDLDRWQAARAPETEVCLYWAHRAPLGHGVEDFLARMPTDAARRDFRGAWRRGNAAGLRLTALHGEEMLDALPLFTRQAHAATRSTQLAYGPDILRPITRVPGAVLLLADHDDGPAGGFLCFHHRNVLYLWTAGIDHTRAETHHTYGWLMHTAVEYGIDHGASTLDAGRGHHAYKARCGFAPVPLTSAVYLTRPNPRLLTRLQAMDQGLRKAAHQAWMS